MCIWSLHGVFITRAPHIFFADQLLVKTVGYWCCWCQALTISTLKRCSVLWTIVSIRWLFGLLSSNLLIFRTTGMMIRKKPDDSDFPPAPEHNLHSLSLVAARPLPSEYWDCLRISGRQLATMPTIVKYLTSRTVLIFQLQIVMAWTGRALLHYEVVRFK